MNGVVEIGKRTHEVRVGMSLYWVETCPAAELGCFNWSALNGTLSGTARGTRYDAVKEARENLLANEALASAARKAYGGVDFMCECVELDGSALTRTVYVVTGHGGETSRCSYCTDCADLARRNWTGETAGIEAAS